MAVSAQAFIALESSLTKRISDAIIKLHTPELRIVATLLSKGDFGLAYAAINKLDFTEAVVKQEKYIQYIAVQSVLFGATQYSQAKKTKTFEDGIHPFVAAAVTNAKNIMAITISKLTRDKLKKEAARLEAEATQEIYKSSKIKELQTFAEGSIRDTARLTSSLHSSRLSSFGLLSEASLTGHTTYLYDAILDKKTSKICELMNGKVFHVERALGVISRLMQVEDPEEFKILAPFPKQDKKSIAALRDLTADELMDRGIMMPPLHPYCRSILRKTKEEVITEEIVSQNLNDLINTIADLDLPDYLDDAVTTATVEGVGVSEGLGVGISLE